MRTESLEKLSKSFEKNAINLEEAKKNGLKVVGQFCLYTPTEIAFAAKAIAVSLCGTKNDSIATAEEVLPRGLCPLIKSSFGFAKLDSCAYLSASDIVVADTTCDGKRRCTNFYKKKRIYFCYNFHKSKTIKHLPTGKTN